MTGLAVGKIVVPVDFSEESIAAVDSALAIASSPKDIHVLHVLPDLNATEPGVVWKTIDAEVRERHITQALQERLADPKYDGVQLEVEIGDAGHRIADFALQIGADLIVIPSHGRTGLSRMLIGSVAERVVRLAQCPVLVLRG